MSGGVNVVYDYMLLFIINSLNVLQNESMWCLRYEKHVLMGPRVIIFYRNTHIPAALGSR